jgi:hypothetical protein
MRVGAGGWVRARGREAGGEVGVYPYSANVKAYFPCFCAHALLFYLREIYDVHMIYYISTYDILYLPLPPLSLSLHFMYVAGTEPGQLDAHQDALTQTDLVANELATYEQAPRAWRGKGGAYGANKSHGHGGGRGGAYGLVEKGVELAVSGLGRGEEKLTASLNMGLSLQSESFLELTGFQFTSQPGSGFCSAQAC